MKKLILPAILLSAYTIRLLIIQATFPEAIVFIGLSTLLGLGFFLLENQRPDPDAKIKEEIAELKDRLHKLSINQLKQANPPKPRF